MQYCSIECSVCGLWNSNIKPGYFFDFCGRCNSVIYTYSCVNVSFNCWHKRKAFVERRRDETMEKLKRAKEMYDGEVGEPSFVAGILVENSLWENYEKEVKRLLAEEQKLKEVLRMIDKYEKMNSNREDDGKNDDFVVIQGDQENNEESATKDKH